MKTLLLMFLTVVFCLGGEFCSARDDDHVKDFYMVFEPFGEQDLPMVGLVIGGNETLRFRYAEQPFYRAFVFQEDDLRVILSFWRGVQIQVDGAVSEVDTIGPHGTYRVTEYRLDDSMVRYRFKLGPDEVRSRLVEFENELNRNHIDRGLVSFLRHIIDRLGLEGAADKKSELEKVEMENKGS